MSRTRSCIEVILFIVLTGDLYPAPLIAGEPGSQIHGKVILAENGAPVEGARVRLTDSENGLIAHTVTGSDGRFRFEDVAAGQWSLTAEADGLFSFRDEKDRLRVTTGLERALEGPVTLTLGHETTFIGRSRSEVRQVATPSKMRRSAKPRVVG